MLILLAVALGIIALLVSYMFWDEKHNWHDGRKMDAAEKGTRKLIYNNPFLEAMMAEHGLLPANA